MRYAPRLAWRRRLCDPAYMNPTSGRKRTPARGRNVHSMKYSVFDGGLCYCLLLPGESYVSSPGLIDIIYTAHTFTYAHTHINTHMHIHTHTHTHTHIYKHTQRMGSWADSLGAMREGGLTVHGTVAIACSTPSPTSLPHPLPSNPNPIAPLKRAPLGFVT